MCTGVIRRCNKTGHGKIPVGGCDERISQTAMWGSVSGLGVSGHINGSMAFGAQMAAVGIRDAIIPSELRPTRADRISVPNVRNDQSLGAGSARKFYRGLSSQLCRDNSSNRMWTGSPGRTGHGNRRQRFL